jgi:hypothetical protein
MLVRPDGNRRIPVRRLAIALTVPENFVPTLVDGAAVVQILLVELVFEPAVHVHWKIGFMSHGKLLFGGVSTGRLSVAFHSL